jgi:hypothetical protein
MRMKIFWLPALAFVALLCCLCASPQAAESTVALKSGETVDLSNLFWVVNCRSLLNGPMRVEVLEGPPEITASIREQKIVPHALNCPKPVDAGVLLLTAAKEVKKKVQAKVVLRVKYPTVDGEKQKSFDFDAIVLP